MGHIQRAALCTLSWGEHALPRCLEEEEGAGMRWVGSALRSGDNFEGIKLAARHLEHTTVLNKHEEREVRVLDCTQAGCKL